MVDMASYLAARREMIDRELAARLPAESERPATLHRAMRYAVLAGGGKRLRPILCLAAAGAVAGDATAALLPALALELFHAYTLVHDDLPAMDDDALRRGQPTCHIQFGEANAILAGDALLTLAFEWMARAEPPAGHPPETYVLELARAGGHAGVIAGQVEDLAAETRAASELDLAFIHERKTGALLRAAVRIGAIAGGADAAALTALSRYADRIGLAFQVADDLLNATSTTEQLGKKAGSDAQRGKTTYVSLYGVEGARAQAARLLKEALDALEPWKGDTEVLAGLARHIVQRER